jgi:L-ascorbate metabolism protein UlaG (beta-lactamase superfamily)
MVARLIVSVASLICLSLAPVRAQPAPPQSKPEMMENCPGMVASAPPRVLPAAFNLAALAGDQARVTFIGHATFTIESPGGITVATDYNDYVKPRGIPDIVTMNHAHSTHYTDAPDPAIKHVLRGWGPSPEEPARHDLTMGDVRVRNVPTNIRNYITGEAERHGNSIFVFEMANLCIAHLGHLHHTLTQQQLNEIGRLDAVMFPVDGSVTLDLAGMAEVLESLKAPLMIPMHYFSQYTLRRFIDSVGEKYDVEMSPTPSVVVSKATLPTKPKVLVLPGRAF